MAESDDRINKFEDQMIDMRLAVSAMLDTVSQHQMNFERIAIEIREMRSDMREMQVEIREIRDDTREIQLEVRGLQTENRRILDILQKQIEEDGE